MKRKKVLSIVMAIMMVFSTTGFSFAAEELFVDNSFTVEQEINIEEETNAEEVTTEETKVKKEVQTEPKIESVQTEKVEASKPRAKAVESVKAVELSITFKYIDRNTKEWTEYVITDSHDNRTIGVAKANNVIANHRTVTDGLVVKTFTGWDTEFPVVLNQSNPTVVVTAQYDTVKKPQLTFKYTDNISTGSGGWQNQSPAESYTHTFKNPLVASPRTNYTFLYWENVNDSSERYTAGQKYKCNSSTIKEDTTVEFVAVYEYQPEVKVLYHFKNGLKDTGAKSKAIDIYADPQAPKSIKHWFYDEEGGNPIQKGELVVLPEKLTPITTEPAAEDRVKVVDVYAHYHGVTFVDEDGKTILKNRVEYQYDTDAADIEKPDDPTKEATAQYTFFFNGWLPTIVNVIDEAVYQASYRAEVNTYTVTWENYDEAVLEIDNGVPYGDMPIYDGATPTKPSTAQFSYEFTGWTPEVSEVTGDIVYTAVYEEVINNYTVTYKPGEHGTFEDIVFTIPYGSETPIASGIKGEKGYDFTGWSPERADIVTEDMVYIAQWSKVEEPIVPSDDDPIVSSSDDPIITDDDGETTEVVTIRTIRPDNITVNATTYDARAKVSTPQKKAQTINISATPKVKPQVYWALLNLILALATCLLGIILLVLWVWNKRKEDEDTEVKNKWGMRIGAILIGILSLIVFMLTEDMNNPWIWIDKWTIVMVIMFVANIILTIFSRHKTKEN